MTAPLGRLLVVDDDFLLITALCDTLRRHGYDVSGVGTGKEALEALRATPFDLLLTDLSMPQIDGIALLKAALAMDPGLVAIVMTGQDTIATAVQDRWPTRGCPASARSCLGGSPAWPCRPGTR